MADVSRNRGQLFLIAAVTIATLLVVLAVILNSGIYTSNLASRGANVDVSSTDAYVESTGRFANDVTVAVNNRSVKGRDYATLEAEYSADAKAYRNASASFGAYSGVVRNAQVTTIDRGTALVNRDSKFRNRSLEPNWTVVDAGDPRGAKFSMVDGSLPLVTGSLTVSTFESQQFYMRHTADGTGTAVRIYPYREGGGIGNVTVRYPGGGIDGCSAPLSGARDPNLLDFELYNATVEGSPCPALEYLTETTAFADGDPHSLRFVNGNQVRGNYHIIVATNKPVVDARNQFFDDTPSTDYPLATEAVYGAEWRVVGRTPTVEFETTLWREPGVGV